MIVLAGESRVVGTGMVLGRDRAQAQRADIVAARQLRLASTCDQANTVAPANSGATWRPPLMPAIWKALASPLNDSARASEMTWPP